ncbi:hypothetical protein KI387_029365, partial [Taxus chinensis]
MVWKRKETNQVWERVDEMKKEEDELREKNQISETAEDKQVRNEGKVSKFESLLVDIDEFVDEFFEIIQEYSMCVFKNVKLSEEQGCDEFFVDNIDVLLQSLLDEMDE